MNAPSATPDGDLPRMLRAVAVHYLDCATPNCSVCALYDEICNRPAPDTDPTQLRADSETLKRQDENFERLTTQGDD